MNKKELMIEMKANLKHYAIPQNMNSRPKAELVKMYKEAQRLGLTLTSEVAQWMMNNLLSTKT